jgi:hypothetical protein
MDADTKQRIEDFAWNCTVGAGRDADDMSNEPGTDELEALARILGRRLSGEDIDVLVTAWRKHEMEIAFP